MEVIFLVERVMASNPYPRLYITIANSFPTQQYEECSMKYLEMLHQNPMVWANILQRTENKQD